MAPDADQQLRSPTRTSPINDMLRHLQANGDHDPDGKKRKYVHLSTDQFSVLLQCFQQQQADISKFLRAAPSSTNDIMAGQQFTSSHSSTSSRVELPTYYNNAKYEDIIYKPLRPTFDGSPNGLILFLNWLDIRRQDEGWYPITFIPVENEKLDILCHFTLISEDTITTNATACGTSPMVTVDKHNIDHPTYNSRVLAKLLLASVTDDFSVTVIHRVPQDLRNDGPLILWTICNNIHCNNIALVETIKAKIRTATLSQFHDEIPKYIIFLRDNLWLITAATDECTSNNDLLTYIFQQLQLCEIQGFKKAIQDWHVEYLEAKLPDLTPTKLLKMADDKMQILQHTGQWKMVEPPAVMTLKAELNRQQQENKSLVQHLIAHLGKLSEQHHYNKRGSPGETHHPYPQWMRTAPKSFHDTLQMNRKQYTWCTKCRRGQGLWVWTHTVDTHQDGFCRNRHLQETNQGYRSNKVRCAQGAVNGTLYPPPYKPVPASSAQLHAQLSLTDYLDSYFASDTATLPPDSRPSPDTAYDG